jgi:hypothetical protein
MSRERKTSRWTGVHRDEIVSGPVLQSPEEAFAFPEKWMVIRKPFVPS